MRRRFGVVLCMCIIFSGCAETSSMSMKKSESDTEKIAVAVCGGSEQSMVLDTAKTSSMCGLSACRHLYEGLFKLGKNGQMEKGQIKEYAISEDGLTYTFYLREDIFWSDGIPVTAKDFVYGWQRLVSSGEVYASVLDMVAGAKAIREGKQKLQTLGVRAMNDKTLVVELDNPCSYFKEILAFPPTFPVREDIVQKQGNLYATDPDRAVYNGAYTLTDWEHQDDLVMNARTDYYDYENIGVDALTWKLFSNETTMLASFMRGDIIYSDSYPSEETETMKENGLQIVPGYHTYAVIVNMGESGADALKDIRVRKALCLAIDRQRIVQMENTEGLAADRYTPTGIENKEGLDFHEYANGWYDAEKFEKNCETAKQLLKQAGYEDGKNFPMLKYLVNNAKNQSIAEMIVHDWKEFLGIDSITIVTNTDAFWAERSAGNFDLAYFSWYMDFPEISNMLGTMVSNVNDANFSNPLFDLTLQNAKKQTVEADVWKNYRLCEKILSEELPVFPIYYGSNAYLFDDSKYENLVYSCGNFYFGYVKEKGEA